MAQSKKRSVLIAAAFLVSLGGAAQAQFQDNLSDIPGGSPANNSSTENVDFGDVDNDGDWDAVFADGGDGGNDRNRIWVNQGGTQGGTTGIFVDQTSQQFPTINDQSRDVEFADIDSDGDLDLYISNTSAIIIQSNRWWVNAGGCAAAAVSGFYRRRDPARAGSAWAAAGSSISGFGSVLAGGGFIDWSCDCDFADLDNDGDLDLFHSTYGGSFGGEVPSRIFLNDGDGFFEEFNPSGFQLPGTTINNGNPGLWCEGTQQANTTNFDGTNCDIATNTLDIDVGDFDGDFDIDILHGARDQDPRIFANRLDGSALAPSFGALWFRDVTGMSLNPSYASTGNYEQEIGDLDGDGDLDIYGMNWPGLSDAMHENNGNGVFSSGVIAPGSGSDDNEADFLDYDSDGNLDVFVANFSGQDRLYKGNGNDMTLQNVTGTQLPNLFATALDADCCDVDGDGDTDVMVANDNGGRNFYVKNLNDIPDTHAPYIPNVEDAPDRTIGSVPTVIRAQVYDNEPYYITWYSDVWLSVTVNGGSVFTVPMQSSGGQIFRGELPGYLCGFVSYRVFAEDQYGNQSFSGSFDYTATGTCEISNFCSSTPNSTGSPAIISSNGDITVANNSFELLAGPVPNEFGVFFYSTGQVAGGSGTPFGNGLQCVGGGPPIQRLSVEQASGNVLRHEVDFTNPPSPSGMITAGSTWHFQAWFRDPAAGGAFFDLSDGMTVSTFH